MRSGSGMRDAAVNSLGASPVASAMVWVISSIARLTS